MVKRILVPLFAILFIIPFSADAQNWKLKRYEAVFGVGTTNFFGDIGGTEDINNLLGFKDIQLKYTRPSIAFGARYRLSGNMAVKMNLIYAFTVGNDIGSRNENRNYAFTATIFEPSFQFEYYIIPESVRASSALFNHRGMISYITSFNVYAFAGAGAAIFNPKPKEKFVTVFQDNFSKFGLVFPIGVGLKYPINSNWSLGFELGRRFTTTDYIDGYKSEYSKHNDTYYFGVINAVYKIRTDRRGYPMFKRKGLS
jgi:opacity protein-like surface antigen